MRWETKWKKELIENLRKTTILVRKNKKTALTTSQLKNFTPHTIFHFTAAWCRIAIFFHRKKTSSSFLRPHAPLPLFAPFYFLLTPSTFNLTWKSTTPIPFLPQILDRFKIQSVICEVPLKNWLYEWQETSGTDRTVLLKKLTVCALEKKLKSEKFFCQIG